MDQQQRAALVRGLRLEIKNGYVGATRAGAGGKRPYYPSGVHRDFDRDTPNPTRRDTMNSYVNGAEGGDSSYYDRSARWDRHRASLPKPRRIRTRRATRDPGGYVGYTGDWGGYFGYSTPGVGRARPK